VDILPASARIIKKRKRIGGDSHPTKYLKAISDPGEGNWVPL
jgi:hypothetical protein